MESRTLESNGNGIKNNSVKLAQVLTALLLDGSPAANNNVWIGVNKRLLKNFHS